jgi:hypothetical protein
MSDAPEKKVAAPPKDKQREMLVRLGDRSDRMMRMQQDYVSGAIEAQLSSDDIRALQMEAADAQAIMNVMLCLTGIYDRQKDQPGGHISKLMQELIDAAKSPYIELVQKWKAS